jgi:hypothetical protein
MKTTKYHRSFHGKKRGVASAIGILFMVGILMTSIIPMFMYVNQVNNYYDMTVVEMRYEEEDKNDEDLRVYAYGANSTAINVWLKNDGAIPVNINRLWVERADLQKFIIFNSTNRSDDFTLQLPASSQATLRGLSLSCVLGGENENKFNIYAITDRGNKFASQTNTLSKSGNVWVTSSTEFIINILIQSGSTEDFKFKVYNATTLEYINERKIDDVHGTGYTVINVPTEGYYLIECWKKTGGVYSELVDEQSIILTWEHPTTFVEFIYS